MRMRNKGVTLLEILLVLSIIAAMMLVGGRYLQQKTLQGKFDRNAQQVQQILNASLSYYINKGKWPATIGCLQGTGGAPDCSIMYLPYPAPAVINNPWGQPYAISSVDSTTPIYVSSAITTTTIASTKAYTTVAAGMLPLGFVTGTITLPPVPSICNAVTCQVVASVNPPPQTTVSSKPTPGDLVFAGLYHNNACVPQPVCQAGSTPQIFVSAAQVMGLFTLDANNYAVNLPITSFSTFATDSVNACPGAAAATPCVDAGGAANTAANYWRVCISISTPQDNSTTTTSTVWAAYQTAMAVTRCSPDEEPQGSAFNVMSPVAN